MIMIMIIMIVIIITTTAAAAADATDTGTTATATVTIAACCWYLTITIQVGIELYDHQGDDGTDFDGFENSNDAAANPMVVQQLSAVLHKAVAAERHPTMPDGLAHSHHRR